MTESQFQFHIVRLSDTFGKQHYGLERVKLLWEAVKDYDESWFRRVVSEFIGTTRQAPLLSEFRAALSLERERLWEASKRVESDEGLRASNVVLCKVCDDSGAVFMRDPKNREWVYRCACPATAKLGQKIPIYTRAPAGYRRSA